MREEKAYGFYGGLVVNETLELNGLTETVYWRDLDRTDCSDSQRPVFSPYTFYTGLTLGLSGISCSVPFPSDGHHGCQVSRSSLLTISRKLESLNF